MGAWTAACLEDQTADMKGDGETVVSKKFGLCGKSTCLCIKKEGVSMGTLSVLLYVVACTVHTDITLTRA